MQRVSTTLDWDYDRKSYRKTAACKVKYMLLSVKLFDVVLTFTAKI